MGVEPFLLASAMKMIISQRLAKRICNDCKQPYKINDILLKKIKNILSDIMDEKDIDSIIFYK